MVQCAACAKFMRSTDGAMCPKCGSRSHHECVNLPTGAIVNEKWRCGDCQVNTPKARDPMTPIENADSSYHIRRSPLERLKLNDTTLNRNEELVDMDLKLEIRSFIEEMRSLRTEMQDFRLELSSMKENITNCRERIETLHSRVEHIEKEHGKSLITLEYEIQDLKKDLNDRDQELLLNDIEVVGLPETQSENVMHLISILATKIGVVVTEDDIVSAQRVGLLRRNRVDEHDTTPRRIVVRFARRSTKDAYLKAARVRRNITTENLSLNSTSEPKKVYINERLTKHNRLLFTKAREESRRLQWKYCWTKEGQILLRQDAGSKALRVRSEAELSKIFGSGTVG